MIRALLVAAGMALATPLSAQVSEDLCRAVFAQATGAIPDAIVEAEIGTDGADCVAQGVRIVHGAGRGEIAADRIAWSGQGLDGFAEEMTPPRALVIEAEGLSTFALAGQPVFDYVRRARQAQRKVTLGFEARWDALTGRLVLDRLEIDFPGNNRLRLSARAEGADLTSLPALLDSVNRIALTEVTFDVTSNGLFEEVALPELAHFVTPTGGDPEASMRAMIGASVAAIEELPDDMLGGPSKAALIAVIESLPTPAGALRLTLTLDPPLEVTGALGARLWGTMPLADRLAGFRIGAQYEPTADTP